MVSFRYLIISALALATHFAAGASTTGFAEDFDAIVKDVNAAQDLASRMTLLDLLATEAVARSVQDIATKIEKELPKLNVATLDKKEVPNIVLQHGIVCCLHLDRYDRHR
jgi:hypothetical protein